MSDRQRPARAERQAAAGTLISAGLLVLLVLGYGYIMLAQPGHQARAARLVSEPSSTPATPTAAAGPTGSSTSVVHPPAAPASPPVRLSIAAIGVDTALQPLGLLPDGSLQPPSQWQVAGWYAKGVLPGNVGPAVIAGHVDSVSGPAVFYRLHELRIGDRITVGRQDRTELSFEVDGIRSYPKASFPSEVVYGPTPDPQLRLITCTGDFDSRARSYLQNLVVSAHLI